MKNNNVNDILKNTHYSELLKVLDNDLNSIVSENKDGFSIPTKHRAILELFLNEIITTLRSLEKESFFEECKLRNNEDEFWILIESYFDQSRICYNDASFLRNMELNNFEKVINDLFQKYILFNDDVSEYNDLSLDKVINVIKILNVDVMKIVNSKFSIEDFKSSDICMFDLGNEKNTIIWNMIFNHRIELKLNLILDKLDDMSI